MPEESSLTFNRFLSLLTRCSQMYYDKELAALHIRAGQIPILRALSIKDGISQEAIRMMFRLDKGTVAKSIKPLVREGYVTRETSPYDKRAYQIFLTDKGRQVIPTVIVIINQWSDLLTADFSDSEKRAVESLLSRMAENASRSLFGPETINK